MPTEGERGSTRWLVWVFFKAGSGFFSAGTVVLLSFDPIMAFFICIIPRNKRKARWMGSNKIKNKNVNNNY